MAQTVWFDKTYDYDYKRDIRNKSNLKTRFRNRFLVWSLLATLTVILSGSLMAQTFTVLHSFSSASGRPPLSVATNSDGSVPDGLIVLNNKLYGTCLYGGNGGCGTIFSVNTDGSGFTNLHIFASDISEYPAVAGGDGAEPIAGVIANNEIYGTAHLGGAMSDGTIFAISTDGTGFTNLYNFTGGSDGSGPSGPLISTKGVLFGTTTDGGISRGGSVFAFDTAGIGFTDLHNFTNYVDAGGSLSLSGSNLYGAAVYGGPGDGSIFALNTNGLVFTNLHVFNGSDGSEPLDGLTLLGGRLYGSTAFGDGTIFALSADGTDFTNLYKFSGIDGSDPSSCLISSGTVLYGSTYSGGKFGSGTIFSIHIDGTGFTNLYNFTAASSHTYYVTNTDGSGPAGLVLSGNTLYGTTGSGGNSGTGTVFSLTLPAPQLAIALSASNVILTWPTNMAGFDFTGYTLQSTTDLASPGWDTVTPPPTLVNGQDTVTNAVSSTQMFYRLTQ